MAVLAAHGAKHELGEASDSCQSKDPTPIPGVGVRDFPCERVVALPLAKRIIHIRKSIYRSPKSFVDRANTSDI